MAEEERPREKLSKHGRQNISDAELLAIILGSGSRYESVVELARRMLADHENDLNQLAQRDIDFLSRYKGVGPAKSINIIAALELGKRRKHQEIKRDKISASKDAFHHFERELLDLPHEEFWVLGLNRNNKVIDKFLVGKGGVSGTVADVRLIFKPLVNKLCSALIVAHNHPSGNLKPSKSDIHLTNKIKDAGKIMDIQLLDHLIIGEASYLSFADEGLL